MVNATFNFGVTCRNLSLKANASSGWLHPSKRAFVEKTINAFAPSQELLPTMSCACLSTISSAFSLMRSLAGYLAKKVVQKSCFFLEPESKTVGLCETSEGLCNH